MRNDVILPPALSSVRAVPGHVGGISGDAHIATVKRGKIPFDEAVKNPVCSADMWMTSEEKPRVDRRSVPNAN